MSLFIKYTLQIVLKIKIMQFAIKYSQYRIYSAHEDEKTLEKENKGTVSL
jgi:hypothetical protein